MARRFWSAFDHVILAIVGLIVLALSAIGVLQVLFRYALGNSLAWTEELSRVLLIWLVLLAAAAELRRGTHIAMQLLLEFFPIDARRWIDRVNLGLILGFAVIMLIFGAMLVERTMEQRATTLPVTMGEIYLAVPIGGALLAINALRLLWEGMRRVPSAPATGDIV